MELLHQPGEIIAGRYRILDTLGQGGVGITYKAQDLENPQQVALKALSLRRMADWKVLELFEREARILSLLNHPGIPRYLDYFQVDTAQDRSFYIAQQLAPGKSLAVLVEGGWEPVEAEVKLLAIQILEILVYLHSLTPAVIHRDIKPQNIILRSRITKGDKWGDLFLVDFGAVQDTYHNTVTGGSTVVGTYGYMAPEQFRGQAVLSTDLYGLGSTILFLLTGKSPADLPQRKLKIDFRSHVGVSKEFADWLEKILEPAIENRFPSAKAALDVLQGKESLANYSCSRLQRPKDSLISLERQDESLIIEITPVGLRSDRSQLLALYFLIWNGVLLLFVWASIEIYSPGYNSIIFWAGVLVWGWLRICHTRVFAIANYFLDGALLLIFFWLWLGLSSNLYDNIFTIPGLIRDKVFGSGIVFVLGIDVLFILRTQRAFLSRIRSRTQIKINPDNFCFWERFPKLRYHIVGGEPKDIHRVTIGRLTLPLYKKISTICLQIKNGEEHHFGLFLTQDEKEWLVEEIAAFLEKVRS